jgi:signal peptidase I
MNGAGRYSADLQPPAGNLPAGGRHVGATNGAPMPYGRPRVEPVSTPRPPDGYPPNGAVAPGADRGHGAPAGGFGPNGHPAPSPVPPPRRPDPGDEPTVVHGRLLDPPEPDEAPGRHRRRAGASPEGRPAASYQSEPAGGRKAKPGRRRRPAFWKELPLLVVVALLLTFLIQTFLAKVYVIPSGSMETTLHGCTGCNNDRVLVDKVTYSFSDPRPGDVVVFRGPDSWNSEFVADPPSNIVVQALQQLGSLIGLAPPDEKDFVKRVIAVGGQTVQCCDSRNRIIVDGQPLDEPYIYYLPDAGQARQDVFSQVTVPQGQLWMMGDSRNNSADSRVPGHGPVPVANVIGKARLIVLPFSRFGGIPDPNPQSTAVGMATPGDVPAPLALGLVGAVPLLLGRRRLDRMESERTEFLPRTRTRRRRR